MPFSAWPARAHNGKHHHKKILEGVNYLRVVWGIYVFFCIVVVVVVVGGIAHHSMRTRGCVVVEDG